MNRFTPDESAMPRIHKGRPFETIGQTLARMTGEAPPEPFPAKFAARLAATMLAEPEFAEVLRAVLGGRRR
jgi:hypothetical protein